MVVRSGPTRPRQHPQPGQPASPAVWLFVYTSRYLFLPCGTTGCMSLPSPRVITPALSAPAISAAPIPARATGLRPRASTGDPGVRTRGIGEPTLHRRVRPPGTGTPPHHHSHSFPVPGSPPARVGLASTGCSASPVMRSMDSKADRRRPARRGVSGSPVVRVPIPEVARHCLLIRGPPEPDVAIMVHALSFLALLRVFRPIWIMPLALRRSQRQPKQSHKQSPE